MNATRRRAAVATTSTLALLAALTGSAWAGTSITAGCTLAHDDYSESKSDESEQIYDGAPGKTMTVTPSAYRTAGSVSASTTGAGDSCDINGGFNDVITVLSGTSGLSTGQEATVTATLTFDGSVAVDVAASDTYDAYASVDASFYVAAPYAGGESGLDVRASTDIDLAVKNSRYGSAYDPWSSRVTHTGTGEGSYDEGASGEGLTTVAATESQRVVTFPVTVGETLDVDMDLSLVTSVSGASSATAVVDVFQVTLEGVGGIVLDRGDTQDPQPEPEPAPDATALELIQQARDAIASYGLGRGIATSYDVKLRDAQDAIIAGDDPCGALESFQSHVEALRGKKLTQAQADEVSGLIAQAQELLGC